MAFDRRIKLQFHGAQITSGGGLLACRELDDAFGLTAIGATALGDGRVRQEHPASVDHSKGVRPLVRPALLVLCCARDITAATGVAARGLAGRSLSWHLPSFQGISS